MRVTYRQIVSRGWRRRCPNCGEPLIYGLRMQLLERCPKCGARWDRGNGFFLGAMVWNYGVTVFGVLSWVALAAFLGLLAPATAIWLGLGIGVVFPVIFYKWSWSLWLAAYYSAVPNELPANAGMVHPLLHRETEKTPATPPANDVD